MVSSLNKHKMDFELGLFLFVAYPDSVLSSGI